MTDKVTNIAKFMKSMDSDIEIIKTEEKRLADRRKAINNRKEGIKGYIKEQMELAKIDKVKTPIFTVAIQNNPAALEITDEKKIPDRFFNIIPEHLELNNAILKDALKAGENIEGAKLTHGTSLRIR